MANQLIVQVYQGLLELNPSPGLVHRVDDQVYQGLLELNPSCGGNWCGRGASISGIIRVEPQPPIRSGPCAVKYIRDY